MRTRQSPSKLVILRWHDAVTTNGWKDSTEPPQRPEVVRSVGWLIEFNRVHAALAADIDDTEGAKTRNREITIPRGMVIDITNVETGDILFSRARSKRSPTKES